MPRPGPSLRAPWQKWFMPRGCSNPREARLESFGPRLLPESPAWLALRDWRLVHKAGANTPNWDIAAGCEIEGRAGIVLVEAKANWPELGVGGSRSPPMRRRVPSRTTSASAQPSIRLAAVGERLLTASTSVAIATISWPTASLSRGSWPSSASRSCFCTWASRATPASLMREAPSLTKPTGKQHSIGTPATWGQQSSSVCATRFGRRRCGCCPVADPSSRSHRLATRPPRRRRHTTWESPRSDQMYFEGISERALAAGDYRVAIQGSPGSYSLTAYVHE